MHLVRGHSSVTSTQGVVGGSLSGSKCIKCPEKIATKVYASTLLALRDDGGGGQISIENITKV